MNIKVTVEITDKELAEALLPNGGKITSVEISDPIKRVRASRSTKSSPKQAAPRKKAAPKE